VSTIRIEGEERQLEDADAQWIATQIQGRRHVGTNPCIRICIKTEYINAILVTPNCPLAAASHRALSARECTLFELWAASPVNQANYSISDLIAFLRKLRQFW
jgi:hypothetical protein